MSCNNTEKCQSESDTTNIATLKYGDADLYSKRRKMEEQYLNTEITIKTSDDEYTDFQKIISKTCLNSSFRRTPTMQCLDYKGGLINSTTDFSGCPPTESSIQSHEICAKNSLTITKKPSLTSKGFENTFKLLQSQVEINSQKTANLMKTLKPDSSLASTSSTISSKDESSRLELELEAIERMNSILKIENGRCIADCDSLNISTPLLTLLCDFVSSGLPKEDAFCKQSDILYKNNDSSPSFIYHATKTLDGRICLRIVRKFLSNKVLCGNRVSQMTRTYDDIEAVTRLLEEKEKDLELTVQIGKELLAQNNTLENRITILEAEIKESNDDRAQLLHELHKKNELIAVLTSDGDESSENETPTFSKSITLDLLQKKIASLQDENQFLKMEASQLASQTDDVEAHERQLMEDVTLQLNEANSQFDALSLELERQREENRLQHEQIVNLTARLSEAEMRLHQLTHDNDEHVTLLNITKENQNSLALELVEFKQRYQEVLALLQEAQDQLRKQRKKSMPQARSSFVSSMGLLQPESLQSELMESSMYSDNSLDSGISGDSQRGNDRISRLMSQVSGGVGSYGSVVGATGSTAYGLGTGIIPPYKRVFETVRCASKSGNYVDSGNTQIGAMSMSNSLGPRMSSMALNIQPGANRNIDYHSNMMGMRTLSSESLASQSDDGYPSAPAGVPGVPGAKDLEAALKRLTPAEVLARRAMLSYAPAGTYTYDEQPPAAYPLGIRTPDSIMSTGSSGISSSTNMSSSAHQWRLPEKLQIVKPIEGSQTLHNWSRLATPTLSGLLEDRPGVTIRGGRGLDDLGMQVYTLSDVEEDVNDDLPGKQFEACGCTYTYTISTVMHPDDGLVNDTTFLSQSQMSSRMASASTSRQPSCPPTPLGGLSRKNSCTTFSVNLGLASMLNERGIKAVTPSALNTPAGPNFSPTVTPCNSPEGSPTRSMSPEPLFSILSSGADLIRRKLVGGDIERPNRNQQKQQKIMLSRLERRALRSLKLVEKVESIGLENIISSHPNAISQLSSGIVNRSASPMAQLTSLKHIHTSSNTIVNDIHFDRDQIKGVLHKGLTASIAKPSEANTDFSNNGEKLEKKSSAQKMSFDASTSADPINVLAQNCTSIDIRVKQMHRQKSRRNLKNGIAAQRSDLGTIGGGRVRNDLGKVAPLKSGKSSSSTSRSKPEDNGVANQRESQSITQAFVGTVSSLLFGRKGGWL